MFLSSPNNSFNASNKYTYFQLILRTTFDCLNNEIRKVALKYCISFSFSILHILLQSFSIRDWHKNSSYPSYLLKSIFKPNSQTVSTRVWSFSSLFNTTCRIISYYMTMEILLNNRADILKYCLIKGA